MKTIKTLITLAILTIFMTSCQKEEDPIPSTTVIHHDTTIVVQQPGGTIGQPGGPSGGTFHVYHRK